MHALTIRTIHDVAYDRGEDYDPAVMDDVPDLLADLTIGQNAAPPIEAPSLYDRRRARARERRDALAAVPEWLTASDLAEPLVGIHGELV